MVKAHGFTLIELVVVIAIVAILAVMPFYNWTGTVISIDAQAKLVADDIRYTQSLAMSKTERYRIVKSNANSYQILDSTGIPATLASGSTTATLTSGLSFGTWGNLTNGLVTFDGRGTPYLDSGAPGTPLAFGTDYSIPITGGGNTKTVFVTPITGRVTIQ